MAATEAVMLGYLISSRPSICINSFGQTVHTYQHIGYVIAQILTTQQISETEASDSQIHSHNLGKKRIFCLEILRSSQSLIFRFLVVRNHIP